eukprot:COSAG06_NODE_6463_length_2923_cov_2.693343_3_plen_195_part_00
MPVYSYDTYNRLRTMFIITHCHLPSPAGRADLLPIFETYCIFPSGTHGSTASSRDGLVYHTVMIMSLAQGVAERPNFVWSPHTCPSDSKHNAAAMTQSIAHPSLSWTEKEVLSTTREKRRMLFSYPDRSSPSLSSYQFRPRRRLAPGDSHPCLAQAPCRLPLRLGLSRCMRSSRLSQAQTSQWRRFALGRSRRL